MPKMTKKYISWMLSALMCFNSSFTMIRAEEPAQTEEPGTIETAEEQIDESTEKTAEPTEIPVEIGWTEESESSEEVSEGLVNIAEDESGEEEQSQSVPPEETEDISDNNDNSELIIDESIKNLDGMNQTDPSETDQDDSELFQEDDYVVQEEIGTTVWTVTEENNEYLLTISGSGNVEESPLETDIERKIKKIIFADGIEAVRMSFRRSYLTWSTGNGGSYYPEMEPFESLEEVVFADTVTSICRSAFGDCTTLKQVTFGNGITAIGDYAFLNTGLISVDLPDTVISIGECAFYNTPVKEIHFHGDAPTAPVGLEDNSIGRYSFADPRNTVLVYDSDCDGWTEPVWNGYYVVPSSEYDTEAYIERGLAGNNIVWKIKGSSGAMNLSFEGEGQMSDYSRSYVNNKWITASGWGEYDKDIKTVTISDGITAIGANAFYGCTSLSRFPTISSVEKIGDSAFYGCSNMIGRLSLPETLTSIGNNAFYDCTGLSGNLILPDSITTIGKNAFTNCSGFYGSLKLPSELTEISDGVFSRDHFAGELLIPEHVKTIGNNAFEYCNFTGGLVIPEGVLSVGNNAFYSNFFEGTLKLPSTLETIGNNAFGYHHFTGDLIIPEGVKSIGDNTFYAANASWNSSGFSGRLVLPDGLENIGKSAFYANSFIGELKLPESVVSIGESAFEMTTFTGDLRFPNSLMTIGGKAFAYTQFDDYVSIPSSVISIGTNAFLYSKKLIHFTFEGEDPTVVVSGDNGSFPNYSILYYRENTGNYTTPKWKGYSTYPIGTPTAEGVKITSKDNIIQNGSSLQLNAVITPENAVNKKVIWSVDTSYYNSAFQIDQNGVVTTTYNDNGYTSGVILATTEDGGYQDRFNVIATGYNSIIRLKGLKMDKAHYKLISGSSVVLNAILDPFGATFSSASWTSSDTSVAKVENYGSTGKTVNGKWGSYAALGRVTGVSPGSAVITATSIDGNYTAQCEVTVMDTSAGIFLDYETLELNQGDSKKVNAYFADDESDASAISWSSNNLSVASVDQNGYVYAVGPGTAVITARAADGSSATCTVTVTVKLLKLELDVSSLNLIVGDTFALTPVFVPANAVADGLVWESDNENVINVNDGQITAVSEGTANATVRSSDGTLAAVCTVTVTGSTVLAEDIPEGGIPDGFWVAGVTDKTYDGTAQKQEIRVYNSQTLLKEKTDYTVSYQNNKNAVQSTSSNAPSVIVTMKGNYQGKLTEKFTIYPVSIEDSLTVIDDITTMYNGRAQLKDPSVIVNGVKLKNGKDYTVTYDLDENYFDPGEYPITITGIGNYTGTREIHEVIVDSTAFLMNKATVSKIPKQLYTGDPIEPSVTVKYKGLLLKEDQDYEVSYRNNISVGTGEMIISGLGDYTGNKIIRFSITGIPLKNASLLGWESSYEYTGSAITQKDYELVYDDQPLIEGQDYQVIYENNLNAGKAKVTFVGIEGFTGKVTKTFKIAKTSIEEADIDGADSLSTVFAKGGAKIFPTVVWNGRILKEGTDYTLKYANNKKVHDGTGTSKVPTVTITGKGNFSSKQVLTYAIVPQSLKELTMTVNDKLYSAKANAFQSKPVITDNDGKKLAAGTDYDKNLIYSWTSNTPPASGTRITVTAKGKGNYTGTISSTYRIIQSGYDISKAKASAAGKTYTGRSITLFPNKTNGASGDLIVTLNGVNLICGKDYEITGYSNNINVGKAAVSIRGIGAYGGQKTVQFQITKTTAVRSCGPNAYYEGGACICYSGYTGNPNTGCSVSIKPTPTPDDYDEPTPTPSQYTPEPTPTPVPTTPMPTPELTPTPDLSTPEPVTCGENAYESGGACYCNDGYTGDPYTACYVIIPEPTPEQDTGGGDDPGGGEDSGGDAEGGEG